MAALNELHHEDTIAMDLTVSVIVPTFNRANYLGECLDSLIAQTVPLHEILVVDDGSEDATAEIVARYGERVRYIYKENGGKPSAVNLGLAHASGDLIWIFDDDDVALPDATANRLAALAASPNAGFVFSPHLIGADGPAGRIVSGRLTKPSQCPEEQFFLEVMKNCFFHLATALVRREYYDTLNGFDTALFSGEDYDFQIRLARIARPAFCPTPSFIFRQHAGLRGAKVVQYSALERSSVFKKSSQEVGRKLRVAVDLGEFLVPVQQGLLTAPARRQALLNRIQVMGNHGCIDELFEDLRLLLRMADRHLPLTAEEGQQLALTMQVGFAYDASVDAWTQFIQLARGLRLIPGSGPAIRALAFGLLVMAKSHPGTWRQRAEKAGRAVWLVLESVR